MLSRWWTYQRERFPIFAHGPLIAAFSFSAVSYSAMLRSPGTFPSLSLLAIVVAFGTAFLFFLELRLADEFKDFEEDKRYRPYRPVQRGLVTLRELAVLWVICGMIQLLLALWLDWTIVLLLALVWVYLVLMSKEFFVGHWLKAHPIPYLISHMVILPLVDLYATACDWWNKESFNHLLLIWFLMASYFNGVVIEIGRKVRAPTDEETGVNTYTVLWGRPRAALAWVGAMLASGVCATVAAVLIGAASAVGAILGVALLLAALAAWMFVREPITRRAKRIELVSGLWTILMYLSVGAVPLVWRWWFFVPETAP
jgi:4-hydroxybenzoate polyprenyltransferase